MKGIILLTCAVIAFGYSAYWTYTNNGDIERYSATATALLGVLTIYFSFFDKGKERIEDLHNQENIMSANNRQHVKGTDKKTNQKNWFSFGNKQKIEK